MRTMLWMLLLPRCLPATLCGRSSRRGDRTGIRLMCPSGMFRTSRRDEWNTALCKAARWTGGIAARRRESGRPSSRPGNRTAPCGWKTWARPTSSIRGW